MCSENSATRYLDLRYELNFVKSLDGLFSKKEIPSLSTCFKVSWRYINVLSNRLFINLVSLICRGCNDHDDEVVCKVCLVSLLCDSFLRMPGKVTISQVSKFDKNISNIFCLVRSRLR
jgi:hypothetical protein